MSLNPPDGFREAVDRIGVPVRDHALEKIGQYLERMLEVNRHMNLTSVRDPEQAWWRHIQDSLAILPWVSGQGPVLDLGSGAGLPGIPVAIVRPDLPLVLMEATGKKARFLEETVVGLGLPQVQVVTSRAEPAARSPDHRGRYDQVLARALAPLPSLIELALPFLRTGGELLAMKGAKGELELEASRRALHLLQGRVVGRERPASGNPDSLLIRIRKHGPTSEEFPRPTGEAQHRPL